MNRRFSQSVFRSAPLSFVSGSADCLQSNIYMTFSNADFGSVPHILVLHRHVCLLPISSCLWNIPPRTCNVSNSYKLLVSTSTILRSVTWRRIESHRSPCDGNWLYTWNHARNKCDHAIGKTNFSIVLQEVQASVLCIFLFTSHMPMSLANLARVPSGFFWAILRKPRRPQTLLCLRLGHRKLNVYISHMLRTPWAAKPSFQQGPLINDQRLFQGPVTRPFPIIAFICAKQTRCQAGTGWHEDLGASKHLPPLAPGIACRATQKLSAPQLFCIGPSHSLPCHASCKVWKPLYKYYSTRLIDCMSNLFRCSKVATLLSATLLWPKVSCPPHVDQHEHPWPPCASKKLHRSRAAAEAFLYEACASHLFEHETCRPRVQKSGTQNALLQKVCGAKVFPGKQFITSPDLPRQPGTAWLISGKLPSVYCWRKKLTLKLKITSPFVPSSLGNKPFPRKHFELFPRKRSRSNVFFDFEGRCSLFAPRRPSNILLCITTSLAPAQRDKGCRI